MLVFGVGVVVNRNPVASALSLVVSFIGLAGLFILLDAHFLGIIQILVYTGAVMVLFLFIIMLLDTTPGTFKSFHKLTVAASILGLALMGIGIMTMFKRGVLPDSPANVPVPTLQDYAAQLFTTYLLPVQIVGFMLLIAMLGVIVLSKRFETKGDAS